MQTSVFRFRDALEKAGLLVGAANLSDACAVESIVKVAHDTRDVIPGTLFVCIRGEKANGHSLIHEAAEKGATAFVMQDLSRLTATFKHPVLHVTDSRTSLAAVASEFYGSPSKELLMIGVTGTNGKTSTAWILSQLFSIIGIPAGYGGTFGLASPKQLAGNGTDAYATLDSFSRTNNSSPEPIIMQRFLRELVDEGAKAAAVEVTSQGVAQKRSKYIDWNAAVFTNLTRDHLDLHGSMEKYFSMKEALFTEELAGSSKSERVAVINVSDPWGEKLSISAGTISGIRVLTYSRSEHAADSMIKSADLRIDGSEIACEIDGQQVSFRYRLIGSYNVENVLAAASTAYALGIKLPDIQNALAEVPAVPGRIEIVPFKGSDISVVVDYAHTPDGLIQVQQSLRPLCPGRLITLFGCGGDRDRGKRPLMAQAVRQWADEAIVTSDNPRSEAPERIIDDILPGFSLGGDGGGNGADSRKANFRKTVRVDRKSAIEQAILGAKPGDTILVAGKGHEDYQEVAGIRHPFLDAKVCRDALELRTKALERS